MTMTMVLVGLIGAVILLFLIKLSTHLMKEDGDDKSALEMRKKQSTTSLRENALKRKLETILEERAPTNKRMNIEEMCEQAGIPLSYGEYRLISYFIGIVLFFAVMVGLRSIPLSLALGFVGMMGPGQLIRGLRNRRVAILEKQVGSFMRLLVERYNSTKNFGKSIQDCAVDFKGQEPMYSELTRTSVDINLGMNVTDAMRKLAKRTGSMYLARMTDYYEIASELGTIETRENLLKQSLIQYEENRKMKSKLRNELATPVRDAYIMVGVIPLLAIYSSTTQPDYLGFMLNTTLGQFVTSGILLLLIGAVWFINSQIGKPLD